MQWDMAWNWALDEFNTGHQAKIVGLALAATIYHLWQERNRRAHNQHFGCAKKMAESIIVLIRDKLANLSDGAELPAIIKRQWDIP
ncbi:hypothetical protein OIU85_022630 [Salix viminalis]|uniref:Reverse transcriptase zinc-binding domain-containing protein n=1 Tax=Salix viminalis TaxID=40686 RepID=A0A9Q0U787_SALVM|nr:hypothetical protein OIU85_022630 [Salix viminalis]